MALTEYRRKRDFQRTREPRGKKSTGTSRQFVIQKHAASHLHYDFRLELDGVLKSWAVPKGPSLDSAQKRLAILVEDHPVEYGKFEGTIPAGQYGGGTVMLWDRGEWEPLGDAQEGFRSGKLKFRLHGEKLSGGWMLVRAGGRGADSRQWLLIKERDEAARARAQYDVTEQEPLSIASGRDLDEIAAAGDRVWNSSSNGHARKRAAGKSKLAPRAKHSRKRRGKSPPSAIKPQLATLVDKAPEGDQWIHEIKFDGYRILASLDAGKVRLKSRNGLDWTRKLSGLAQALASLKVDRAVLDGEVVALNERGVSDFQTLQQVIHENKPGKLIYEVFDLPWLDGDDLRPLPLVDRKAKLAALRLPTDRGSVRYAEHIVGNGPEFFRQAQRLNLEGIISKRADRPYMAGRGPDWLKIKCVAESEFVVGGFTSPAGARRHFGALLLGYYDKPGQLKYAGRVGTGFNDALLASLGKKLHALEIKESPFSGAAIQRERGAHWVRPELVAQVRFTSWTRDGLLRHPVFLGLREDKPAKSVHRERPRKVKVVAAKAERPAIGASPQPRRATMKTNRPAAKRTEMTIAGQRLTHPDKLLYPDDGITKLDLAEYYLSVAERMLSEAANRPLAIVRCPDGLGGEQFFQKHPSRGILDGLNTISVKEGGAVAPYAILRKPSDLVTLVQFGALELHVWGSRADNVERPDRLVFDLDPAPDVPWKRVVAAARQIREFLQALKLESLVKTSGGKGLHLVVPIARRHGWDVVKTFCHGVATAIVRAEPKHFTATMSKSARGGKIFIDYLRNQRGATAVRPYSTRARTGAPIAMPLSWKALDDLTSADQFRPGNVQRHLASTRRDPWAGIADVRQALTAKMQQQVDFA